MLGKIPRRAIPLEAMHEASPLPGLSGLVVLDLPARAAAFGTGDGALRRFALASGLRVSSRVSISWEYSLPLCDPKRQPDER